MKDILIALAIVVGAMFLLFGIKNWDKWFPRTNSDGSGRRITSDDTEVKCELRDAYGKTITITGHSDDAQFQNMCKQQPNQPVYVYGYPYYFLRWWKPKPAPTPDPEPET